MKRYLYNYLIIRMGIVHLFSIISTNFVNDCRLSNLISSTKKYMEEL